MGVYHRFCGGTAEEDRGSMGMRWDVALGVCGFGCLMFLIQAVSTGMVPPFEVQRRALQ